MSAIEDEPITGSTEPAESLRRSIEKTTVSPSQAITQKSATTVNIDRLGKILDKKGLPRKMGDTASMAKTDKIVNPDAVLDRYVGIIRKRDYDKSERPEIHAIVRALTNKKKG